MSRIGRKPVVIPAGVEVKLDGHTLTVKGPKGTLTRTFHNRMNIAVENNEIIVTRPTDDKEDRSLHGLTRTLIHNMVEGVTNGFKKELEINGVGYRAAKSGKKLTLTLGYSHPVEMEDPEGIETTVEGTNKIIVNHRIFTPFLSNQSLSDINNFTRIRSIISYRSYQLYV